MTFIHHTAVVDDNVKVGARMSLFGTSAIFSLGVALEIIVL